MNTRLSKLALLLAFVAVPSFMPAPILAQDVLLERQGPGDRTTVVRQAGGKLLVERARGGARVWAHELPAVPDFLQVSQGNGAVAVGHITSYKPGNWARVVGSGGNEWVVPGDPRLLHLSRTGTKVLVQMVDDGRESTRVFTSDGDPLAELPIGLSDRVVRFSVLEDAVFESPSPDGDLPVMTLFEIDGGTRHELSFDDGMVVLDAMAIDAQRILFMGPGGTLGLLRLPVVDGDGPIRWTTEPEEGGYTIIRGIDDGGSVVLVTRSMGAFDLVDTKPCLAHEIKVSCVLRGRPDAEGSAGVFRRGDVPRVQSARSRRASLS